MKLTKEQKIRKIKLLKEKLRRKSKLNFYSFSRYMDAGMEWSDFHKTYYKILDMFADGKIKKLIITVPPQHGKSEGSTRKLPAYLLGRNPNLNVAIGSYNTVFARKFNRSVQRIIDTKDYHSVFPKSTLNGSNVVTVSSSYLRNSEEFEIVGHNGSFKAVGRGGGLTGNKVDVMIMDDLYKDSSEANSPVIREGVWDWYRDVVRSRYHNNSQEIIVFTRWHEEDLVGKITKIEKVIEPTTWKELDNVPSDTWVKINFQAIKDSEPTEIDDREVDEVLWGDRHSYKKLDDTRKLDTGRFESLYQGNPVPKEGILWDVDKFKTYKTLPVSGDKRNRTDTADKGSDYLCSINFIHYGNDAYVTNILYTQDGMEITEEKTALMLDADDIKFTRIESNNGGEGFARNVKKYCKYPHGIEPFHQSGNKESRIHTESANVQNNIIFPEDWMYKWPGFYEAIKHYKKVFKANKHDDAADTLTGVIEDLNKPSTKLKSGKAKGFM